MRQGRKGEAGGEFSTYLVRPPLLAPQPTCPSPCRRHAAGCPLAAAAAAPHRTQTAGCRPPRWRGSCGQRGRQGHSRAAGRGKEGGCKEHKIFWSSNRNSKGFPFSSSCCSVFLHEWPSCGYLEHQRRQLLVKRGKCIQRSHGSLPDVWWAFPNLLPFSDQLLMVGILGCFGRFSGSCRHRASLAPYLANSD